MKNLIDDPAQAERLVELKEQLAALQQAYRVETF